MNRNNLLSGIIVVLAILGYYFFGEGSSSTPSTPVQTSSQTAPVTTEQSSSFIVPNQTIYDLDGRIAYQGDIDLNPTLDRIQRGEKDSHDNDGAVFSNREGRLPKKNQGYYHEYVVRTPGISHAGPQRIIMGSSGEIYYTPDHYESFLRLDP